ncbi:MAG: phosphodiester glycosidase family protein [Xenococcaceae cyanobacterium MO_188.B29]|nr:phosphodiester glycosidase family protein [Xenococcaceae cyanobacterium MO_188.B29]
MSKRVWWGDILLVTCGLILSSSSYQQQNSILYDTIEQEQSIVHTVTIPDNSNFVVTPAIEGELQPITDFATKYEAIAVINGGYFDPKNQKTTSYLVKEGTLLADPRTNERLIDNPDLAPYLGKILNRVEFRRYLCGEEIFYDITLHNTPSPNGCELKDALGGGPTLLPQDTSVEEGFVAYSNGKIIRNAIGTTSPNARSAVGIKENGDIVFAMVEQKPIAGGSGMSLPQLADFLSTLGVTKAMNLDGGSSASLYYQGQTFYGRLDKEGNKIKRPIKSVLLVQ